jgi:hypothetical protein
MSDIIDALRLAKERAVESENDEDLARFRDAEKQAMAQEWKFGEIWLALGDLERTIEIKDENVTRWDKGFDAGAHWAVTEMRQALRRIHGIE